MAYSEFMSEKDQPEPGKKTPRSRSSKADRKANAASLPNANDRTIKGGEAQEPSDFDGEQFGRYEILGTLGRGGMGTVYLARDPALDRKVAIKIPHFPEGAEGGNEALERFQREARAIAAMQHPNICPIYEVGEFEGIHYMVMAFIKGHPLSNYIRSKKKIPITRALWLVRKIALGLAEAHGKGIIHRDLKPDNIMINRRGEPIIMDFGLARQGSLVDTNLTQAGTLLGTPAYMSPEQVAADNEKIGPQSDVYSLGVILYELLTGSRPFQDLDLFALLTKITTATPDAPSTIRTDVDPELDRICLKAMEKELSDRHGSATEFSQDLYSYLTRHGAKSLKTQNIDAYSSVQPEKNSKKWLPWLVGVGCLSLIGIAAAFLWPSAAVNTASNNQASDNPAGSPPTELASAKPVSPELDSAESASSNAERFFPRGRGKGGPRRGQGEQNNGRSGLNVPSGS
jgi:serine/threonine protein kinase